MLGVKSNCKNCGKDLSTVPWRYLFCSEECKFNYHSKIFRKHAEEAISNNEVDIGSVFWGVLRKKILKRDNYTCQVCGIRNGDGTDLEIHHIKPRKKQGKGAIDNLITLCSKCHKKTFRRGYGGVPIKSSQLTLIF